MTSILESKFGSLIDTELPGIFTDTCFKLRSLEESRIVEKLARPISLISKMELMDAANAILLQVQAELQRIQELSAGFKNNGSTTIDGTLVNVRSWRIGIRRVQTNLNDLYQVKFKYFDLVNEKMNLGLRLVRIDQKKWAKDCLNRLSSFCFCGLT